MSGYAGVLVSGSAISAGTAMTMTLIHTTSHLYWSHECPVLRSGAPECCDFPCECDDGVMGVVGEGVVASAPGAGCHGGWSSL